MTGTPAPPCAGYIGYAYETTYGTAGSPINKVFGEGQKISTTVNRNLLKTEGVGDRNFHAAVPLAYEAKATVDAIMANCWWLRGALGSPVSTASGATFTHTYNEANTIPSFTIEDAVDMPSGTDLVRSLKGAFINSVKITAARGEPARVTFDCPYANEGNVNALMAAPVEESYDTLTFAGATFTLAGSAIAEMDSTTFSLGNNCFFKPGLGSQVPTSFTPLGRRYQVDAVVALKDVTEFYNRAIGAGSINPNPSPAATLALKYTNMKTGASENTLQINLGSIYFDTYDLPKSPDDLVKESVTMYAIFCGSATYTCTGSPAL